MKLATRLHSLRRVLNLPRPPFWLVAGAIVTATVAFLPLSIIALARATRSTEPRVMILQDMAVQPKYEAQSPSAVFPDRRAMRPRVPGTVARGQLREDDHLHRGYTATRLPGEDSWEFDFFDGVPPDLEVSAATIERGQNQYNVYCSPCHGLDGYGNGPVHQRAVELEEPAWIPPTSLHTDTVRGRPDGHLYNTIANGIRNMAGYGQQIDVEDRWAIVLYVRALQLSQFARPDDVPPERIDELR